MSNLTQTAANVGVGSVDVRVRTVISGEAISDGMPVFRKTSDNKWYQSDANVTDRKYDEAICVKGTGAADGTIVIVDLNGSLVNLGATLVVGTVYVVSATQGAICPLADISSGEAILMLGIATTASLLETIFRKTAITKP
jgi:hypothetical protein